MKSPKTRYVRGPEGAVAYQVIGDGPMDLVFMTHGGWNLDLVWERPELARYLGRLASFSRLILFNPRGTALSDPIPLSLPPTPEEWNMDVIRVMDAVSSGRAAYLGAGDIGPFALLLVASFPDRFSALALMDCWATRFRKTDYPWGTLAEGWRGGDWSETWGTEKSAAFQAPEKAGDERFLEWYGRLERSTISLATIRVLQRILETIDVRGVLSSIQVPTLIISHTGNPFIEPGHGRYLAEHIPTARYVERPGFWRLPWLHDVDWTLDEVQSFFTGNRPTPDLDDRVLATVLFTDIVGSTRRAAELGDKKWRELLDEYERLMEEEIQRFRGRPIKSTGDGMLATFDGPARAIRSALAMRDSAYAIGIDIYTGLHTGEIELRGEDVGGIAVSITARVMSEARPGEILVSGSIPPLVAGSGIQFEERGVRELKGVPGEWRIFAVKS